MVRFPTLVFLILILILFYYSKNNKRKEFSDLLLIPVLISTIFIILEAIFSKTKADFWELLSLKVHEFDIMNFFSIYIPFLVLKIFYNKY